MVGSYAVGMTVRTDRAPLPGETVEGFDFGRLHGGKGSNQAVACARLGAEVFFVARVGSDADGDAALDLYRDEGVDISFVTRDPELPTGVGIIIVDGDGENQIVVDFGANRALSPEYVRGLIDAGGDPDSRLASASVWLTQLEIEPATAAAAMGAGKRAGAVTIMNPAPYRALPDSVWSDIDIITPNQTETRALLGLPPVDSEEEEPERLAAMLVERGVGAVVLTLGARGAYVHGAGHVGHIPAPEVTVVDTTGAGDAFAAALGTAVAEGRELPEAVRFAVVASALAVGTYGVVPSLPRREEVDALYNKMYK